MMFRDISPDEPCDRCSHPSKYHAGPDRGSICMVAGSKPWHGNLNKRPRATACWCDGFVPEPRSA